MLYDLDLDPEAKDDVGLDVNVETTDGQLAIPLFPGNQATAVQFTVSKGSDNIAVGKVEPFVGEGLIAVPFAALVGNVALGSVHLGPQGGNLSNAN